MRIILYIIRMTFCILYLDSAQLHCLLHQAGPASSRAVPRWISRARSPRSYVIGEHGVHTQYLRRISLCSPAAGPRCPIWSLLRCLWEREREEAFPRVPFALLHAACEQRPAVLLPLSFASGECSIHESIRGTWSSEWLSATDNEFRGRKVSVPRFQSGELLPNRWINSPSYNNRIKATFFTAAPYKMH